MCPAQAGHYLRPITSEVTKDTSIVIRSLVSQPGSAWRSPQGGASPNTFDRQHLVQLTALNLPEMGGNGPDFQLSQSCL